MDSFEHNLLVDIENKLNRIIESNEHRLTKNEVKLENQQIAIDKRVQKIKCETTVSSFKKAVGFLYAFLLTVFSAVCYKVFSGQ